ncbi:MAG TPA: DUF3302 domain-containing protein [Tepidisphaeraceae bacterium]|jgi:hypothetical protein|nr:DUF3302 domain-containing protein [Tepidisphaeraceae bacterium]
MNEAGNVLILVLMVVFAILMAAIPGWIARRRNHSDATAITVCGRVSTVFWPLWLVVIVWAFTQNNPASTHVASGFPVQTRSKDGRPTVHTE